MLRRLSLAHKLLSAELGNGSHLEWNPSRSKKGCCCWEKNLKSLPLQLTAVKFWCLEMFIATWNADSENAVHIFLYTSWLLLKHLLVARGKTKDRFCIFPAISIIKHWICDDILRICAVWRLIRFAQSTISIHKCIQTCQFVSSFCAPSRELAHNRLVECVQLICPFV